MVADSMLPRFEGTEGKRRLEAALRQQVLAAGDAAIATELTAVAQLIEFNAGDLIIRQDAGDNDLFLILSGALRIVINGRDVAIRRPNEHVGEMVIVDAASPRTANVTAGERPLLAKIPNRISSRSPVGAPSYGAHRRPAV